MSSTLMPIGTAWSRIREAALHRGIAEPRMIIVMTSEMAGSNGSEWLWPWLSSWSSSTAASSPVPSSDSRASSLLASMIDFRKALGFT
ncbi:hypothetical protein KC349_g79 [Hortaea werneckii]|nr:hypothetical protein KC349_g79 [Hortaea werneckii]